MKQYAMIKKTMKLIITFPTTTRAMAMEKACREAGAPGRLIPVPREITAGCGLAWCAPTDSREALVHLMEERNIAFEQLYEMMV